MRGVGRPFVHQLGGAVDQRSIGDVAVPGDPADVGRAPEHICLGPQIERVLVGESCLREIAAGGMQDAFRLAGGTGGVKDEQRVLGVMPDGGVLGARRTNHVVPPEVPAFDPFHRFAVALDHHHIGDSVALALQRAVDRWFQRARLAAPVRAVGSDNQLCLGVVNPAAERIRGEASEHH